MHRSVDRADTRCSQMKGPGMGERARGLHRMFSWLPADWGNRLDVHLGIAPAGVDSPGAPRRFGSTEHLSTEALAAFVDNELAPSATLRATHHLALCPRCAAEVAAQRQARAALRDADPITAPSTLLGMLSRIPLAPPIPPDDLIGSRDQDDPRRERR